MKKLFINIKSNRLTGWQVVLLTSLVALVVFGGLYLIDPTLVSK